MTLNIVIGAFEKPPLSDRQLEIIGYLEAALAHAKAGEYDTMSLSCMSPDGAVSRWATAESDIVLVGMLEWEKHRLMARMSDEATDIPRVDDPA